MDKEQCDFDEIMLYLKCIFVSLWICKCICWCIYHVI